MVDTIKKALNPLFLTAFIFGCGILRHPLNQPRVRLSILYILIIWSAYACAFYYIIIQFSMFNIFNMTVTLFVVIMNWFVTIISTIITIREHEKFDTYIKKLDLVDNTLEKLGTPKEYQRLQNLIKWVLIILFVTICSSWTFDVLLRIETYDTKTILVSFVIDYPIQINNITDVIFMLLLRHIGTKLDKINRYIEQLSQIEDYGIRCNWKKSFVVSSNYIRNAKNRKRVLWTVMHLHSELCRIARDINDFFGIQMTLQMISYFVVLIGMCNFLYFTIIHLTKSHKNDIVLKILLNGDMWFIIFLLKLILINHICESVSNKAQKTKSIIHSLTNLIYFAKIREEIFQFVLQVSLRPLKFNGLGLFYFGYDFIHKFFIWILTSFLFMVQMNITPISGILISAIYNTTGYD